MNPLSETFQFSQASLQAYVDCHRRFQLRYVLMQPWPALIVDSPAEAERQMQRGATFHQLAQQHTLGLDPALLASTIHDDVLAGWWQTYLRQPPPRLPEAVRRAEVVVTAPLAGHRLLAKFDLLAVDPGERITIVDWKTSLTPPSRATLERRMQTRVYRYLAVEAAASYNGGQPPRPEQVEMIYWFANDGGSIQRFTYDAGQHAADRDELATRIREIAQRDEDIWPLTPYEQRCQYCNYRSLCERGVRAGFLGALDEDPEPEEPDVDLEQIAEIEF